MISSLFDTIKDRTRNPFFATLISVWLVRNWELVYTLFNFDVPCTLGEKKIFILRYYNDKIWYEELFVNITFAFGLMIVAYVLIIVSRLIVNVTDHNIIPRMNEKTVSNLVVNKDIHNSVKNERNSFYNQLEEEREKTIRLEEKFGKLKFEKAQKEEEALDLKIKYESEKSESEDFKGKLIKIENDFNKLKFDYDVSENLGAKLSEQNVLLTSQRDVAFKDFEDSLKTNINLNEKIEKFHLEFEKSKKYFENQIKEKDLYIKSLSGSLNNLRQIDLDLISPEIVVSDSNGSNYEPSFLELYQTLNENDLKKFQELLTNNIDKDFDIFNTRKGLASHLVNVGLIQVTEHNVKGVSKTKFKATNKGVEFYNFLYNLNNNWDIS